MAQTDITGKNPQAFPFNKGLSEDTISARSIPLVSTFKIIPFLRMQIRPERNFMTSLVVRSGFQIWI
jgi:hypothetical protein